MQLPATFGKYELLELLGGGGMSQVYRGRDRVIGRDVAVKILRATADPDAKSRFLREAQTLGSVRHENIIQIYDFGEEQGIPYLVMELLQGQDLRKAIRANTLGAPDNRLRVGLAIARALSHIHSKAIVHRDIKPDNIHLDLQGKVTLMDFGIAKTVDSSLTMAGYSLGTPSYMAPEQVRGEAVSPAVDVYAFGILLLELLTGFNPVSGGSYIEVFQKVLNDPVDLAPLETAGADGRIVGLIGRCLSKNAADRPPDFQEVCSTIEKVLADSNTPSWMAVLRNRLVWFIAAGVILVFLLLGVLFRRGADTKSTADGEAPPGMVLVPAGPFPFAQPPQTITLPAFYIDRTEVSNADYSRFTAATNRPAPQGPPNDPVTNITIDEASAYAKWAGKRLPTPQEWEKAARGNSGRLYPWGDKVDPSLANVSDNPTLATHRKLPVESLPEGASPYGVLNMAGNVAEFVFKFGAPTQAQVDRFAQLLDPAPKAAESWCLVRGGSFDKPLPKNSNIASTLVPARYRSAAIGFRCVRNLP